MNFLKQFVLRRKLFVFTNTSQKNTNPKQPRKTKTFEPQLKGVIFKCINITCINFVNFSLLNNSIGYFIVIYFVRGDAAGNQHLISQAQKHSSYCTAWWSRIVSHEHALWCWSSWTWYHPLHPLKKTIDCLSAIINSDVSSYLWLSFGVTLGFLISFRHCYGIIPKPLEKCIFTPFQQWSSQSSNETWPPMP